MASLPSGHGGQASRALRDDSEDGTNRQGVRTLPLRPRKAHSGHSPVGSKDMSEGSERVTTWAWLLEMPKSPSSKAFMYHSIPPVHPDQVEVG